MARAPTESTEGNFVSQLFVGVGVHKTHEVFTTEAMSAREDVIETLLDEGCVMNSIRVFELNYNLRLEDGRNVPSTRVDIS